MWCFLSHYSWFLAIWIFGSALWEVFFRIRLGPCLQLRDLLSLFPAYRKLGLQKLLFVLNCLRSSRCGTFSDKSYHKNIMSFLSVWLGHSMFQNHSHNYFLDRFWVATLSGSGCYGEIHLRFLEFLLSSWEYLPRTILNIFEVLIESYTAVLLMWPLSLGHITQWDSLAGCKIFIWKYEKFSFLTQHIMGSLYFLLQTEFFLSFFSYLTICS